MLVEIHSYQTKEANVHCVGLPHATDDMRQAKEKGDVKENKDEDKKERKAWNRKCAVTKTRGAITAPTENHMCLRIQGRDPLTGRGTDKET